MLDTKDERHAICGQTKLEINGRVVKITLDGEPAVICGWGLETAYVADIYSSNHLTCEFAWPTVARILTREKDPGAFRS